MIKVIGIPITNRSKFNIPKRKSDAKTGSEFIQEIMDMGLTEEREKLIAEQILDGNIPDFMRIEHAIRITDGDSNCTIFTLPDYLCIGASYDYVRMPMNPMTAQTIANAFNACLPTRKIVNDLWSNENSKKLEPQPWGPPYDASMYSSKRYMDHSHRIDTQVEDKEFMLGQLFVGHKKDVVNTANFNDKDPIQHVAIYGWQRLDGTPIQGPGVQSSAHAITYADYSHGIRLISREVHLNKTTIDIYDVLESENDCSIISDEGVVTNHYPIYEL